MEKYNRSGRLEVETLINNKNRNEKVKINHQNRNCRLYNVMFSSFFFLFRTDSYLEYERHNRTKYFRTDNSCCCNTIPYCVGSRQDKCLEAKKKKELTANGWVYI